MPRGVSLTDREFFLEFLLNQTEIRLCLAFSDRFGTKRMSVWFQMNRTMLNIIGVRFDLIRIRKISLCVPEMVGNIRKFF